MLVQRDEVAQLHLALVNRQLQFIHARDRKSAELEELHSHKHSLEHELAHIQASELAASGVGFSGPIGELTATPEGAYGFFPAAGTNYGVGEEPTIAERLNTMGKALHLHLIGISGYRSPQHSVEVGGFANDPHTRGEASDTPGVEGVSESTLNQFGLTRPFPGAAEADHIQLRQREPGAGAEAIVFAPRAPRTAACAQRAPPIYDLYIYIRLLSRFMTRASDRGRRRDPPDRQ